MPLHKLMRKTLETYLERTACKVEPTPAWLNKCLNKRPDKWVRWHALDDQNYPIYVTTEAGRKALLDDS
jgi:hypothetical protein